MIDKINIAEKFAQFSDYWSPKIAGEINEFALKFAKLQGEFVWHHHEAEDELFLVIHGRLLMKFRDGDVWVEAGEMIIVPHGVEHCPVAPEEVHLILLERKDTLNTGNVQDERTKTELDRI